MRQSVIVVHDDPKSISSEAFRMLRTNLQYTSPDKELRSLIVTSAGAGEGKSTVSSNLAAAMAQSGIETCIVGCDVRKSTLHHIFGVPNAPGLTSVLVGQAKLEDAILKTRVPGVSVLPSGPIPPNPSELLQSKTMKEVISDLKEKFEFLILDTPPVVAVADTLLLSRQVDGMILVVAANMVPKDVLLHAKALIDRANANLLGVVLNRVRAEDQRGYQYYYYYSSDE
ncbi:MAG: CpsD/CapB family tyrosine-protein kinase [Firmicutes bacterium]|nr:CpsD/CapB family tyrosine-protein kinase [Bacillota bacterium]